jgi:hypothetical protein
LEAGLTRPEFPSNAGENAFGINDAGVVVGSMGIPSDPCAAPNAAAPTEPRAFVRLPIAPVRLGLGVTMPAGEAVNLHALVGLPTTQRSTANAVSESGEYIVGQSGVDFDLNGASRLWRIPATDSTVTTVNTTNLTSAIAGAFVPTTGWVSAAHGVWHPSGSTNPYIVGACDATCTDALNFWGSMLHWNVWTNAQFLLPSYGVVTGIGGGFARLILNSVAREVVPAPPELVVPAMMGVGWESDGKTISIGGDLPSLCLAGGDPATCTRDDQSAVGWIPPWDDDIEMALPDDGFPRDRTDLSSPPIEPPIDWPTGQGPPGRRAFNANADAEWVGEVRRVDNEGTQNDCYRRAFFAWPDSSSTWTSPYRSVDLDEASGYTLAEPFSESRADALSRTSSSRDRLIVGGVDLERTPPRATVWCGYGLSWQRQPLHELVRFDDVIELSGTRFDYSFPDVASESRITFIHDMNASGQMVVTLTLGGTLTVPPGEPPGPEVEYVCIVTSASDLNGDFRVDSRDITLLAAAYGTAQSFFDLDGSGSVDSGDYAWLLGDFSGNAPVDLHGALPCVQTEGGAGAESASSTALPEIDLEGFVAGAMALGFVGLGDFSMWIASADEDAADAAVSTIFAVASSLESPAAPPEGGNP